MPGVIEGGDLRGGFLAGFIPEEDVVAAVGVERRVEVDQVYAGRVYLLAQDGEVVPVVEGVQVFSIARRRFVVFPITPPTTHPAPSARATRGGRRRCGGRCAGAWRRGEGCD